MKRKLYLKTPFWEYNLKLRKSNYLNNNKLYLGLVDIKNWEYFSDITVNLDLDPVYNDYNFIDRDFIDCCFSDIQHLEERLKDNLKIKEFHKLGDYYYFKF